MPRAGETKLKPASAEGEALRKWAVDNFGSVSALAREAKVDLQALRRRIYTKPKMRGVDIDKALREAGVPARLLAS